MVLNQHERRFAATPQAVGALIDGLAGPHDRLWPIADWPAIRLDRPLEVGARGGHGPIRYRVRAYRPGEAVRFQFEAPAGFDGYHEFEALALPGGDTLLRHTLAMRTRGAARMSWPLLYRPLHDALTEDGLDRAAHSLGLGHARRGRWTWRVRLLRTLVRRARRVPSAAHAP